MKGLAPRLVVSLNDLVASSTQSAITLTPSPCFAKCVFKGESEVNGVVSTNLILSCFSTYDALSRTPVSKPAYAKD